MNPLKAALSSSTALVHVPKASGERGRPPTPPAEQLRIVIAVCERIVSGQRLITACRDEGISWKTLWRWKQNDPDLGALYARARAASGESWEDAATRHADEATPETVQVARLREDNARWRASVANPKA